MGKMSMHSLLALSTHNHILNDKTSFVTLMQITQY